MVQLKSPYPSPAPVPDASIYQLMFNAPGQEAMADYVMYIDGLTGRSRTYYEFRELVYDGATALVSPALVGGLALDSQRDIVGIFSHNCMDYIVLSDALLAMTIPLALLSAFSTPYELAHALRTSGVTCIFADPALLPQAISAAKEVGLADSAIHILEGRVKGRRSFREMIDDVRGRRLQRVPAKPATKRTLAYLVFSSGTTGLPKAVMCTHGNLWFVLLSMIAARGADEKYIGPLPAQHVVSLVCLPFYHAYGFFMSTVRPYSVPSTVVILPKWDIDAVLMVIPRYRISSLPIAPSLMHQLVNHPAIQRTDLSSIESVITGAAYAPPYLFEAFLNVLKNAHHIGEGYGSSEMTLGAARNFPPGCFGKTVPRGSIGVLSPGVEGKIIRQDGSEADYDEPGELCVRGEGMSPGYFRNEAATKEAFVDGWLHTGDTFKVDRNGFLYFIDRAKDTMKIGGAQVSPTEIEEVLRAQPDALITDVCVAGVSGGRTSDEKIPRAWIVLSTAGKQRGAEQTLQVLDEWTRRNLSRYKWLRGGYEVVDEIPKNPTGKVVRRLLQERFEQGRAIARL